MAANIFTTADQIITHYPFLRTVEFDSLKPSMRFVERRYRPELMDATTYGTLLTEIDDIPAADARWQTLIELTRDAFALLIAGHWVPHGNVAIGQMGLQVEDGEHHKPASKDRKNDLLRGIHEQAIDCLDAVIQHLNDNADFFTDYASSAEAETNQKSLLNTAVSFNDFYPIGTNRWIWRLLKPWRNKAEQSRIIGTLGQPYFDELITQAKAATLTTENAAIYAKARQALAFATMELSIANSALSINEGAVTIYNNASQPANDLRTTAELARIAQVQKNCKAESDRLLREIERELRTNASATKYATFFGSDQYTAPADVAILNDTEKNPNPGFYNAL